MPMNYIEFRAMHANAAKAAGEKLSKDQYARLWADYKVEEGIVVKPKRVAKAKGPSCKTFMSAADCAAPCAWRTYGPKSKKSPVCYSPRTLSQTARAGIAARAAARAAARPARQPKVKAVACKTYLSAADCAAPCAWRTYGPKSKKSPVCYKPSASRAPAAFRSSMGFGQFQQTGAGYAQAKNRAQAGGYFTEMPKAQGYVDGKIEGFSQAGGYYTDMPMPMAKAAQAKQSAQAGGYFTQHAGAQAKQRAQAKSKAKAKVHSGGYWF